MCVLFTPKDDLVVTNSSAIRAVCGNVIAAQVQQSMLHLTTVCKRATLRWYMFYSVTYTVVFEVARFLFT